LNHLLRLERVDMLNFLRSYDHVSTFPDYKGQPAQCIKRLSDNAFIPFDPANTDYAEYLEWLAEGNEPLPADETPE
jgi:hypothetical protein